MATTHIAKIRNPIEFYRLKRNLPKSAILRALHITNDTYDSRIKNMKLWTIGDLLILGGLFGVEVEALAYLIVRSKQGIERIETKRANRWYIDESIKRANNDMPL